MTFNVYTIYDSKAEEFGPIFEAKNDSVAIRKCRLEFKDVPSIEDYSLYVIGFIDHDSGVLDHFDSNVPCAKVCDLKGLFDFEESNE